MYTKYTIFASTISHRKEVTPIWPCQLDSAMGETQVLCSQLLYLTIQDLKKERNSCRAINSCSLQSMCSFRCIHNTTSPSTQKWLCTNFYRLVWGVQTLHNSQNSAIAVIIHTISVKNSVSNSNLLFGSLIYTKIRKYHNRTKRLSVGVQCPSLYQQHHQQQQQQQQASLARLGWLVWSE